MKVTIANHNKFVTLALIDPSSGINCVRDFIGNAGAFVDGQFLCFPEDGTHHASQETVDWWVAVLNAYQQMDDRIHALRQEHGYESVTKAIGDAGNVDLANVPAAINAALDDWFGAQGGHSE